MSVVHSLTAEELRVLACLIEKSYTTPDQYPLSTNALTTACNQKTSRDPIVDYSTQLVDQTLQLLRDAGWARMIRTTGSRAFKHRQVVDEKLGLTTPQQAVLAVLALRGPQSPGELKARTERYHRFEDLEEVERVLAGLSSRDEPLTRNIGRASGQSQDRWVQLLGPEQDLRGGPVPAAPPTHDRFQPTVSRPAAVGEPGLAAAGPTASSAPSSAPAPLVPSAAPSSLEPDVAQRLEVRVAELERRLAALERELGMSDEDQVERP